MTMDSVLTSISSVLDAALGWVGSVGSAVTSTPILLIGVILGFVGIGIGLFRRLLNV